MSGIIASVALPPIYEALARSYNITEVLPRNLSFLENVKFDGKTAKIWFQSLPDNFSLETLRNCGKAAKYHFNHLRTNFPAAIEKYPESIKLAGCFFGTSYLLERTFVHIPVVKNCNPYVRKAFAFLGGGAATVFAAHHILGIKTDAFEVAEMAARVTAIAFGTTLALKVSQTALQALSATSKIAANSMDCFMFNPLERQEPAPSRTGNPASGKVTSNSNQASAVSDEGASTSSDDELIEDSTSVNNNGDTVGDEAE